MTEQATAPEAVTETATPAPEPEITVSENDAYDAAYDRLMAGRDESEQEASTDEGQARDENGRFTSTDKPQEAKADAKAEQDGAKEGDDEAAKQAQQSEEIAPAPAHLPNDIKANWAEIPAQARAALLTHTQEQDRKFGELGRQMEAYKPIREIEQEFAEYFDGTKGSYKPAEAMKYLFSLQRKMDADPIGTIYEIANTYGIANQLAQPTDGTREIASLHQTIKGLQQQLAKQNDPSNLEDTVSRVMENRTFTEAMNKFASEQPFYAEVEASLPAFIEMAWTRLGDTADRMTVLETAYDMAVNAIPEVRAKAQAAKVQQSSEANAESGASKAAEDAAAKRKEAAARAASINVKSTTTGKTTFASEDDALGAAFDRAMSSAA